MRIYVDHGEAYGNLGDEAMLLNALRRLEEQLGPCEFTLPGEPGKPLPSQLSPVSVVLSPYHILLKWVQFTILPFALIRRMPGLQRIVPIPHIQAWKLITWLACKVLDTPFNFLFFRKLRPFLKALQTCTIFYGVGAADFNDYWHAGVIYKDWLYKIARQYVEISAVSAQGIGPLEEKVTRKHTTHAFSNLDILSFRDYDGSMRIVKELNPPNVAFKIVGDEAFSLPVSDRHSVNSLLTDAGLVNSQSFVAIHFRTTDYTRNTEYLIPRLASLLDELTFTTPHIFVFFPMSYHEHSRIDEDCGLAIKAHMKYTERMLIAPTCKDARTVKGAIGRAKYSLGLSYHVHVFSLSQGHPSIILYTGNYYKYKSEGLIGFYGSPNASLNLEEETNASVLDAIANLERNYANTCAQIEQVNLHIESINDWTLQEIKRLRHAQQAAYSPSPIYRVRS